MNDDRFNTVAAMPRAEKRIPDGMFRISAGGGVMGFLQQKPEFAFTRFFFFWILFFEILRFQSLLNYYACRTVCPDCMLAASRTTGVPQK